MLHRGSYTLAWLAVFLTARLALSQVIKGVNLGGWLLTEQWLTPSLYGNTNAADEWSFCNELGKKKCLSSLKSHWNSFIVEDDFRNISAAGLNTVRIPVGYWAVDLQSYEPYVQGQWQYLKKAMQWAKQYHLSVVVSLHGVPGSQNGQENSGLEGQISFANNASNSDRALNVLRNFSMEFSQEEYGGVVKAIEVLNEPRLTSSFTDSKLLSYYMSASNTIQKADSDHSLNVTIHDAFQPISAWEGYNLNVSAVTRNSALAPNLSLDTHQYYAYYPRLDFTQQQILDSVCAMSKQLKQNTSESRLPPTFVGEWSLATGSSATSSITTNETAYQDWLNLFFEAQDSAYSPNGAGQSSLGWIFWTWRTENDVEMWSYRRGLADGYIPSNINDPSLLKNRPNKDGCIGSAATLLGAPGALLVSVLSIVVVLLGSL